LDWEGLIQFADQHGLTPLLYSQLRNDSDLWSAVPLYMQQQLQQRYLYSAQRNLRLYHQFLKLIKVLKQVDIPVIVLKGIYLAYAVYHDYALRPMVDVDVLVRRGDVDKVESALSALGYRLSDWKHRDWCLKYHYHLSYTHPELDVNLELHWHIQRPKGPYPVEIDELWRHAQPISIAGVELLALSHEHLLLYHCLHIAKHGFGVGLRPFCDLAAILRHYHDQIDWHQVQVGAEGWRIAKAVGLSLYFTHEFLDGVTASILETHRPVLADPDILDTAREQIYTIGSSTSRLSSEFLQLWAGEPDQSKVSQLLRRMFLPPDLMASNYQLSPSSWRVYLYYPVRLLELLVRYPRIVRQMARRDASTLTWATQTHRVDALREWLLT
jgi:hypothetical protein